MRTASRIRNDGGPGVAVPRVKSQAPDQTTEFYKLSKKRQTWSILSSARQSLHRTLDGRLFIADVSPVDLGGRRDLFGARVANYCEAWRWIRDHSHWRKPEWMLQFHGIMPPAGAKD